MSDAWVEVRLRDVVVAHKQTIKPQTMGATLVDHYSLPAFDNGRTPERVPASDIKSNKLTVPPDSVLVSRLNPHIPRIWSPRVDSSVPSMCSTEFAVLTASHCLPAFLQYFIASDALYGRLVEAVNGTSGSHQRVPLDHLLEMPALLPPPDEQRRIAEVLGALDDRIESSVRLAELLLNEAQAIYEVRVLAESAQIVRVGDVVSALDKGVSYKGAGLADEGPWLVNLANFSAAGRFKRDGTKHYTLPVRPQHRVHPGDLVIANTDLTQDRVILGQPALIPPGAPEASITHHVYAARFTAEKASYRLPLYFALRSQDFQDRAYLFGSGTTVAGLSRDAVLDYACAMPGESDLPALSAELATRLEAAWRIEAEIDELRTARDFLLPRLVSGELRVAAAAELVEVAT